MPGTRTAWYVCLTTACRGRNTPGCRVHALRRPGPPAYSCMHTHGSAWRPPAPSQWVRCGPRNLNALDRACMRACMRGGVQQRPAGKEEAHAFARPPTGCKLCALCSRNASSRAESRTVRNGRSRRWGCCRTPRDMGIIAEQVPGPERGYRAACGVQQRSGPATAGRWLSCGWATPCSAGPSLTEEGREGPREIIYEPSSPIRASGCQRTCAPSSAPSSAALLLLGLKMGSRNEMGHPGPPAAQRAMRSNERDERGQATRANCRPAAAAAARCRCPLPLLPPVEAAVCSRCQGGRGGNRAGTGGPGGARWAFGRTGGGAGRTPGPPAGAEGRGATGAPASKAAPGA